MYYSYFVIEIQGSKVHIDHFICEYLGTHTQKYINYPTK